MMDLKEIIRWFIPCFHIFLVFLKTKMDFRVTVVFLILLFSFCSSCVEAKVNSAKLNVTKELDLGLGSFNSDVSFVSSDQFNSTVDTSRSLEKSTNGRTFGRPFKKMAAALIPLVFQLGAASTWALVAALLGAKTLLVTLAILKILLLVGAAKFGALFASHKPVHHEHHQEWDPKKEIHLHIHNGHHETHEEHISASPWSRGGEASPIDSKYKVVVEPYGGPQTISTPFGNYVKIDPGPAATT